MPKVHTVKAARKDYPDSHIKVGDTYYWWSFRFGPTIKSKVYPKRGQLTQSAFLQEYYSLEEFEFDSDDLENSVDDLVGQIDGLCSECQSSLDNMPDGLRESSDSGMLLQERIDALESWVSELQSIDLLVEDDLSEDDKNERLSAIVDELQATNPGL